MKVRTLYRGLFSQSVCLLLAFAMATSPSANALAQQPTKTLERADTTATGPEDPKQLQRSGGDTTLLASPEVGKLDLTYVSPLAVVVVMLRPHQLLTSPALAMMPIEVASAAGLEYLGNDPTDVEQVTIFSELPLGGPPNYGTVLKFVRPFLMKSIPSRLIAHTQPGMLNDEPYLESANPLLPSIYSPDATTVVIAPDLMLRRLVSPPPGAKAGKLVERIREVPAGDDFYVAGDIAAFRPLIALGLSQAKDFPPEAKPYLDMPNLIDSVDLSLNLTHDAVSQLVVHANDEASAEKLLDQVKTATEIWQDKMTAQMRAELTKDPNIKGPIGDAYLKYLDRVSHVPPIWHFERAGSDISLFSFHPGNSPEQQLVTVAVIGILVALLLPAIQAAREAARRNQSLSQLKQLVVALHEYYDAKKSFPPNAVYDANGKPLLSWRVLILPYIEERELYNQFHLDEAWDSPNNRPLIAKIPAAFASPNLPENEGKTNYLAAVGKDCIFDGTNQGIKFFQIKDGSSKTLILVEADDNSAVEWTKPGDWSFDPDHPTTGLGHVHPGVWQATWADGRGAVFNNDTDPQTVKAFFTRDGGEAVQMP